MEPIKPTPPKLEDGGQAIVDNLVEVNPKKEEDPDPTFISTRLSDKEQAKYIDFLKDNNDVFT